MNIHPNEIIYTKIDMFPNTVTFPSVRQDRMAAL